MGYHRAGFEVVGVDISPQPRYPFEFVQADALEYLNGAVDDFDAIHASPPCQAFSTQTARRDRHPDLIAPTRALLIASGLPYVIENVPTAPLLNPVRLCGSSFGLDLRRHRHFEANFAIEPLACDHSWQKPRFRSLDFSMVQAGRLASVVGVHGHLNYPGEFDLRCKAMGIDWMTNDELVEAIPPAYTEWIGGSLRGYLDAS